MKRRKSEYPNTSWGREAEADVIENQAKPAREAREPGEYNKTFDAAIKMLEERKSTEEVRDAFDKPAEPLFTNESGVAPLWAKVNRSVEESMVFVRKKAIANAISSYAEKRKTNDTQKSGD